MTRFAAFHRDLIVGTSRGIPSMKGGGLRAVEVPVAVGASV